MEALLFLWVILFSWFGLTMGWTYVSLTPIPQVVREVGVFLLWNIAGALLIGLSALGGVFSLVAAHIVVLSTGLILLWRRFFGESSG